MSQVLMITDLPWARPFRRRCAARRERRPGAPYWGRCELSPHSADIHHALGRGFDTPRWSTDWSDASPVSIVKRLEAVAQADTRLVRDILEALCERDGLSLESNVLSGEPARNYELAQRLGIGHVFGIPEETRS